LTLKKLILRISTIYFLSIISVLSAKGSVKVTVLTSSANGITTPFTINDGQRNIVTIGFEVIVTGSPTAYVSDLYVNTSVSNLNNYFSFATLYEKAGSTYSSATVNTYPSNVQGSQYKFNVNKSAGYAVGTYYFFMVIDQAKFTASAPPSSISFTTTGATFFNNAPAVTVTNEGSSGTNSYSLFAALYWSGDNTTDWSSPGGWQVSNGAGGYQNANRIPTNNDVVYIGVAPYSVNGGENPIVTTSTISAYQLVFGTLKSKTGITPRLTLTASTLNLTEGINCLSNASGTIVGGASAINLAGNSYLSAGSSLSMTSAPYIYNSAKFNMTGATLNISSGVFTNYAGATIVAGSSSTINCSGTLVNQGTLTIGSSGSAAILNVGAGTVTNSNIVTLGPTSIINLNAATAAINSTAGTFTLQSDATGSATVSAITKGAAFTGTVNVERFVTGGALANRGYRLFSSAVTSGSGNFSLAYLKSNSWLTGTTGTGGGFDKTGNPTIYLFREDMAPSNATFTSGNFRGVKSFPTPPYAFDGESSTYNIPVGNGFLFFFRGDKSAASLVAATTSTTIPASATFSASGTLNTGSITVKPWYSTGANLGYSNATANTTIRGYNLVGNPYPSTINWEKYNRNGTNSSIYGSNSLPSTIYIFNANTKNYAAYQQNTNPITSVADTTTTINPGTSSDGVVSNMIASGQGFFVVATSSPQSLTFRESAKTPTQPLAASTAKIMGMPAQKLMGQPLVTSLKPDPIFRVKLAKDSLNTDAVTFVLNNKNDARFSALEDALDVGGNGALVSLSSLSADSVLLSINRLPMPKQTPQILPLIVNATSSGLYSLKMDMLKNLPALYQVWLKDAFKGDSVDIRAAKNYDFNIDKSNAATFGNARFKLVISQNPALALKLIDFNGSKVAQGAKLSWMTENESDYTNFTVERSTDGGKTFNVIGGQRATSAGTYALVDPKPVNGLNQYRLKQDDINGTISYSKTVDLMYAADKNLTVKLVNVYPNPASSIVNISINEPLKNAATYTISISNSNGITVKSAVSAGLNWQADVSGFLPGTYLVQVINNSTKTTTGNGKFIKL
jgi:hypothetical protein